MKKKILIIEDDPAMNHGIELLLGKEEYEFCSYYNLKEAEACKEADLLILDLNLPDGNGLDFLRRLRKTSQMPVLILTANDTELDEVSGLLLGADDYVKKPFSLMALRLRVRRLLLRSQTPETPSVYDKKGLHLDFDKLCFSRQGRELELSKTEIRLLRCLTENEGITLTRERLMDYVWQNQQYVDENALTVSVKRLRHKLENEDEKLIHTVYGIGYSFKWE